MDIVNTQCNECGGRIGINRQDIGHPVRCPLCQHIFQATPAPEAGPLPAPEGPPVSGPLPGMEGPGFVSPEGLEGPGIGPAGMEGPGFGSPLFPEGPGSESPAYSSPGTFSLENPPSEGGPAQDLFFAGESSRGGGPSEGESIFSPAEDASDDLFGEAQRPVIDIPGGDAPASPHIQISGPVQTTWRQEEPAPTEPAQEFSHSTETPPENAALLQDHPSEAGGTGWGETHGQESPEDSATALPTPAPTVSPRYQAKPSFLVPILLIALIPYSIFTTLFLGYLLYQQRNLNKDPTIDYLEKMLEDNLKSPQKAIKRIMHDARLPAHLRTGLRESLAVGAVEVKPLKVGLSPQGDLVLYLRLKNISGQNGTPRLQFNPLPIHFAEYDHKKKDPTKPYVFLDAGPQRLYGGKVQYMKGEPGAERPAFDSELVPGEEMTVLLITQDEDRAQVQKVLETKSPLLWRVQLRRGLEVLHGSDWPITCVVGVEFKSGDIQKPSF